MNIKFVGTALPRVDREIILIMMFASLGIPMADVISCVDVQ